MKQSHKGSLLGKNKTTILFVVFIVVFLIINVFISAIYFFEKQYRGEVYPGVKIDGVFFGGKTRQDIENYFQKKSLPFQRLSLTLIFEDAVATLSGTELKAAYDGKLSATQAYSIGRSGHILSDLYQKWTGATVGINLTSIFSLNSSLIDETLSSLAISIDFPSQDALFQFDNGKVKSFKPSKSGRKLNIEEAKKRIITTITTLDEQSPQELSLTLPVEVEMPKITTETSNTYGVKELLAEGKSRFHHSIPGRVHNVELAASRMNGHLIAPGAIFSFNDALGDVSAATGFAPAYIIKDGRTVLGDGGGVCQVSTTLFRAALNAGLPIVERHAHAYRVSYYEEESAAGLDATVFAPSYDFKFKNDTGNYILIQTEIDTNEYALAFKFYGTKDDRKIEMTKPILLSQSAPPAPLYQDDPTLPNGIVKQVDFSAWGGKTTFDYTVYNGKGEVMTKQNFTSVYRPWQAVFLKGTKV